MELGRDARTKFHLGGLNVQDGKMATPYKGGPCYILDVQGS